MNVYSYICAELEIMARKIDEDKLLRIKNATMKTIVDFGIEGTTITMIAKNANVSGGYLYRLYSGKQALIEELYSEKVASLNKELEFLIGINTTSIAPILQAFIQNRIVFASNEPEASKFFYQLLHNNNFTLTGKFKETKISLIKSIKKIGVQSGEISESTSLTQIHYHILVYVVDYIQYIKSNIFEDNQLTSNEIDYLVNNILNIFKKVN